MSIRIPFWLAGVDWLVNWLVMHGWTVQRRWWIEEDEPVDGWATYHRSKRREARMWKYS